MKLCRFGIHDWTRWELYLESGTSVLGWPYATEVQGKRVAYSEKRQKRSCKGCGFHQDQKVL